MVKMADLIKTALNEVGCEELPSGCDDISVEQAFIENSISPSEQPVSLPPRAEAPSRALLRPRGAVGTKY